MKSWILNAEDFRLWSHTLAIVILLLLCHMVSEIMDMAGHYACSVDIHPSLQSLLDCGVAEEETAGITAGGSRVLSPLCIVSYGAMGRRWKQGAVERTPPSLNHVMDGSDHASLEWGDKPELFLYSSVGPYIQLISPN